jgi:hypothetical protein
MDIIIGQEYHYAFSIAGSTPVAPAYSKRYKDMKSSLIQRALCF